MRESSRSHFSASDSTATLRPSFANPLSPYCGRFYPQVLAGQDFGWFRRSPYTRKPLAMSILRMPSKKNVGDIYQQRTLASHPHQSFYAPLTRRKKMRPTIILTFCSVCSSPQTLPDAYFPQTLNIGCGWRDFIQRASHDQINIISLTSSQSRPYLRSRSFRPSAQQSRVANPTLVKPAQTKGWPGYARDEQHTAMSSVASQPLTNIHWSTKVDLQSHSGEILIHYGSPLLTPTAAPSSCPSRLRQE